jgi:hypothetical protein
MQTRRTHSSLHWCAHTASPADPGATHHASDTRTAHTQAEAAVLHSPLDNLHHTGRAPARRCCSCWQCWRQQRSHSRRPRCSPQRTQPSQPKQQQQQQQQQRQQRQQRRWSRRQPRLWLPPKLTSCLTASLAPLCSTLHAPAGPAASTGARVCVRVLRACAGLPASGAATRCWCRAQLTPLAALAPRPFARPTQVLHAAPHAHADGARAARDGAGAAGAARVTRGHDLHSARPLSRHHRRHGDAARRQRDGRDDQRAARRHQQGVRSVLSVFAAGGVCVRVSCVRARAFACVCVLGRPRCACSCRRHAAPLFAERQAALCAHVVCHVPGRRVRGKRKGSHARGRHARAQHLHGRPDGGPAWLGLLSR